jgi:hypothetical protein
VLNVMPTAEAGKLGSMTIIRHRRVGATQCRQDNDRTAHRVSHAR